MNVTVEIRLNKMPALDRLITLGAREVVLAGAEATVADAKEQIESDIKSGVQYPNLPNRSSAPDEAPANQLGELVSSIEVEESPDVTGIAALAVAGGEKAPHAQFLEFGTSRMAPRPFMGPAAVVGEEAANVKVAEVAERIQRL